MYAIRTFGQTKKEIYMERKDILAKLKAKYSNLGYSQTDMEAFAETVEKQTEGQEDSLVEEAIDRMEPYLKTFQKMADKLRSEKSAAEKEEATKNKKAKGAPTDEGKQTKGEDEETSVIAELKKLRERIELMEGDKIQTTRKANFEKQIANLPDPYKKAYSHINLKALSDEEYDNLLSQIAEETKDVKEVETSRRAVFKTPFAGNRNNPDKISDKEVDEIVGQMKV